MRALSWLWKSQLTSRARWERVADRHTLSCSTNSQRSGGREGWRKGVGCQLGARGWKGSVTQTVGIRSLSASIAPTCE